MARIKHASATKRRKNRVLKRVKGQFGHRSKRFRQAIRSLTKGMQYAYRGRKLKKREMRRLWNIRINAACRELGMPYSRFIKGLTNAQVAIDRKMLADLAVQSPEVFAQLVNLSKENLAAKPEKKTAKKRSPKV